MTNGEKYTNEILAELMNHILTSSKLEELGIPRTNKESIGKGSILKWLNSEYKKPKVEYIPVTHEFPQGIDIEVTDNLNGIWVKRKLVGVLSEETDTFITNSDYKDCLLIQWKYARIRKDWNKKD